MSYGHHESRHLTPWAFLFSLSQVDSNNPYICKPLQFGWLTPGRQHRITLISGFPSVSIRRVPSYNAVMRRRAQSANYRPSITLFGIADGPSFGRRLLWIALSILWMGTIFYLSHQSTLPKLAGHWVDFTAKHSAHFAAYLLLGLLIYRSVSVPHRSITSMVSAIVVCTIYAICDEVHQVFIPGRYGTVSDVAIDIAGSFVGVSLVARSGLQGRRLSLPFIGAFRN